MFLVTALAQSGRIEESEKALTDLLAIQPDCTIPHLMQRLPFTDESDPVREQYIVGLRQAGMPE